MPRYSFRDHIRFFSEKLDIPLSDDELSLGEIELFIDEFHVLFKEGKREGSLHIELTLAILLYSLSEPKLKELISANFLGVDSGGCTLAFNKSKDTICLEAHTTAPCSPQENWEWLHRLLAVAREWVKVIALWDECITV